MCVGMCWVVSFILSIAGQPTDLFHTTPVSRSAQEYSGFSYQHHFCNDNQKILHIFFPLQKEIKKNKILATGGSLMEFVTRANS